MKIVHYGRAIALYVPEGLHKTWWFNFGSLSNVIYRMGWKSLSLEIKQKYL